MEQFAHLIWVSPTPYEHLPLGLGHLEISIVSEQVKRLLVAQGQQLKHLALLDTDQSERLLFGLTLGKWMIVKQAVTLGDEVGSPWSIVG